MNICYVSPNRSHHVQYAMAMDFYHILHCFITGASRLSPRASIDRQLGDRLIRYDLFQSIYQTSAFFSQPTLTQYLERKATNYLANKCFEHIHGADVFLYYRTIGMNAVSQIKANNEKILCVMEEVNSHVLNFNEVLAKECTELGIDPASVVPTDLVSRLEAYEQADLILCPSSYVYTTFLERGFQKQKLILNNFGVNRHVPSYKSSIQFTYSPAQPFRLLYVGQLHLRKGLRYAIEAFDKLNVCNKEFVIVGPSTPHHGLHNLDIPSNVRFVGSLKGRTLREAYLDASAFVLPSLEEGLALVLTEALSYGLPVIATKSSGAEDLIVDGQTGFLVNSGSSSELLVAMQALADSYDLRHTVSENASKYKFLDWNECTNLLQQTLAKYHH